MFILYPDYCLILNIRYSESMPDSAKIRRIISIIGKYGIGLVVLTAFAAGYAYDTYKKHVYNEKVELVEAHLRSEEYRAAVEIMMPLAEKGDIKTLNFLVRVYVEHGAQGRAGWKDLEKVLVAAKGDTAPEWFRHLASRFEKGDAHLRADADGAVYWYRLAAEYGNRAAREKLYSAYREGRMGLRPDKEKAEYWGKLINQKE